MLESKPGRTGIEETILVTEKLCIEVAGRPAILLRYNIIHDHRSVTCWHVTRTPRKVDFSVREILTLSFVASFRQ